MRRSTHLLVLLAVVVVGAANAQVDPNCCNGRNGCWDSNPNVADENRDLRTAVEYAAASMQPDAAGFVEVKIDACFFNQFRPSRAGDGNITWTSSTKKLKIWAGQAVANTSDYYQWSWQNQVRACFRVVATQTLAHTHHRHTNRSAACSSTRLSRGCRSRRPHPPQRRACGSSAATSR